MGKLNINLIDQQSRLAENLMKSQDLEGVLTYHNWEHVLRVKKGAEALSNEADLSVIQKENLLLAAIWHDVDFGNGAEGHELRSANIAAKELKKAGLDSKRVDEIVALIRVTEMGKSPNCRMEAFIKDADLSHLGAEDYFEFYDGLYTELKSGQAPNLNHTSWQTMCLNFFEKHEYHSEEGRKLWSKGKRNNIAKIKSRNTGSKMEDLEPTKQDLTKEEKKALKKERKKNEPKFNTEKGIETMFRVSLRNHINLSRIADDKANTLISVNAIILSIVLSALFPKMDSNPWLIYPGMALILVSISTIILSTLSTIPKTTHGSVSIEDVKNKKGNLLFFGNFHKMSLEEFEYGIGELMKDGSYLYGSLTRDLYFLGKVLERKYGLLRRAYVVFVFGLVISILLFTWSILTLAPDVIGPENSSLL